MRKQSVFPLTIFFVLIACALFFLASTQFVSAIGNGLSFVTLPVQRAIAIVFVQGSPQGEKQEEKIAVLAAAVQNDEDKKEMQALRDQFETAEPRPFELMPAKVVGLEGYIPGVSKPIAVTIDKGAHDGIKKSQVVVYKDNLVGKVVKVTPFFSSVILLTNEDLSFTGETLENKAAGVVHGGRDGIMMENIVLSDKVSKGDVVVTKGDLAANGLGFPPGLIVGQVVSTEKKQSDLFQLALIKSLVDPSKLSTVFVLKTL